MLSRLLYAARTSLFAGVLATLIATALGVFLGLLAGYFGGLADILIMRFTDMVMSFHFPLLIVLNGRVNQSIEDICNQIRCQNHHSG